MLRTMRTIAPDDPRAGEIRQFADRLQHVLAVTPRDQHVPELDRIAGSDSQHAVTCFVDVRGEFIDLSMGSDWYYTVGPAGIGPAVLDALAFAQEKSLVAMLMLGPNGRSAEEFAGDPYTFESAPEPPRPRDLDEEVEIANAQIRRAAALMDAADRLRKRADSPEPWIIAGPRGLFRLTMVGFTVHQADVDEYAVSASDVDEITDDARAALLRATREKNPRYWMSREG